MPLVLDDTSLSATAASAMDYRPPINYGTRREPTEFSIHLHFSEDLRAKKWRAGFGGRPFRLVRMNRDSAIYGLELERCAALAYIGVDVIANFALKGDREAHRYAAVYCLRH